MNKQNDLLAQFAEYFLSNNLKARAIVDALKSIDNSVHPKPLEKREIQKIVRKSIADPEKKLPVIRSFDKVDEEQLDWLWYPYICRGTLGLLDGDPGCGKSQFTVWLAAMLSRGKKLPNGEKLKPINTFLLNMEDLQGAVIKKRLKANSADMARVFIQDRPFQLSTELTSFLDRAIAKRKAQLVILDPIQAFIKPGMDASNNVDVRNFMSRLADIAERRKCAIICVRHFGKAAHDKAMKKGIGATDFVGIARNQFGLAKRNDGERGFIVFHMKTNFEKGKSMLFKMSKADGRRGQQPQIDFDDFSSLQEDEYFSEEIGKRGPAQNERELAKELLMQSLKRGPKFAEQLKSKAESRAISTSTLDRARKDLQIKSFKDGKKWKWKLPTSN